jgi:hypothetical protein
MDYENISNWAKRTQFKPKQSQFQMQNFINKAGVNLQLKWQRSTGKGI